MNNPPPSTGGGGGVSGGMTSTGGGSTGGGGMTGGGVGMSSTGGGSMNSIGGGGGLNTTGGGPGGGGPGGPGEGGPGEGGPGGGGPGGGGPGGGGPGGGGPGQGGPGGGGKGNGGGGKGGGPGGKGGGKGGGPGGKGGGKGGKNNVSMMQLSSIRNSVMNDALFRSLSAQRVSNFAITAPLATFLRTRQPIRVLMKDGSYNSFAALNTNTSTANLDSYDLSSLIEKIKSLKKEGFLVVSTTADGATPSSTFTSPMMSTPPAVAMTKEQLIANPSFEYSPAYVSYANEIILPVNQYLCGCCWALCTSTAVSDSFVVSGILPQNPKLSFSYSLSCYPSCLSTDNECLDKDPTASVQCGGGNYADLAKWIMTNGIAPTTCVDYSWCSGSTECNSTTPPSSGDALNALVPSCGCTTAGSFSMYKIQNVTSLVLADAQVSDPTALAAIQFKIKEHIVKFGPVLVGLLMFSNIMSGNYQSAEHPEYNPNNVYLEYVGNLSEPSSTLAEFQGCHALCIVGWATCSVKATLLPASVQSSLKIDEKGFCTIPCWKIRNSWGTAWGNNGHFFLASYPYNTSCCVEVSASFTDPSGTTSKTGGMVIFEPVSTITPKELTASTKSAGGTTTTTSAESTSAPVDATTASATTPAAASAPTTSTNTTLTRFSMSGPSSSSSRSTRIPSTIPSPYPSSPPTLTDHITENDRKEERRSLLKIFIMNIVQSLQTFYQHLGINPKIYFILGIIGLIGFYVGVIHSI